MGWNNLNVCCELIKNSSAWFWWKIGFWKITLIKSIYCKFQMDGNLIFRICCSWIGINHHSILSKISFDAKSWQQYWKSNKSSFYSNPLLFERKWFFHLAHWCEGVNIRHCHKYKLKFKNIFMFFQIFIIETSLRNLNFFYDVHHFTYGFYAKHN